MLPCKIGTLYGDKAEQLNIPKDSIIAMINHHGKIRIAHGTSILTEDDIALVFAKPKAVSKIKKLFLS